MFYIEGKNGARFVGFFGGVSVWARSPEVDAKGYLYYASAEYDVARLVELGHRCHIRTSQEVEEVHAP